MNRSVPRRFAEAAPMLTHFTRAAGRRSAMDNLVNILREGIIRGSSRMIRGPHRVVCMFDAPLRELEVLLSAPNRRRYEPFGLAVDKHYAFAMGARPVIYLPWREAQSMLAPEELWRVVSIDMERTPPIDWSFEREWRLAGDLAVTPGQTVVLVESWSDADEIYHTFGGHPPCSGVMPLRELFG